jgi:hypothetical protein
MAILALYIHLESERRSSQIAAPGGQKYFGVYFRFFRKIRRLKSKSGTGNVTGAKYCEETEAGPSF